MRKFLLKCAESFLNSKIIANWRVENYQQARQTRQLFEYLKISIVLDIGANEGQYADFLRHDVGFDGIIISFEPAREPFEILETKSENDPRWACFRVALGAENGKQAFNIMKGSQYNSLLVPEEYDDFEHKNTVVEQDIIEVETLNDMWFKLQEDYNLSSVFLKMDTQGFDLEVLRGGDKVLRKIRGLQSELAIILLYKKMPDYIEVIQYLEREKFAVSSMYPVIMDKKKRLMEFDGIFVNTSLSELR